jgi:hypothetical protein
MTIWSKYVTAIWCKYVTAIWSKYVTAIWSKYVAIWDILLLNGIFFSFGMLYKEISGNPSCEWNFTALRGLTVDQ